MVVIYWAVAVGGYLEPLQRGRLGRYRPWHVKRGAGFLVATASGYWIYKKRSGVDLRQWRRLGAKLRPPKVSKVTPEDAGPIVCFDRWRSLVGCQRMSLRGWELDLRSRFRPPVEAQSKERFVAKLCQDNPQLTSKDMGLKATDRRKPIVHLPGACPQGCCDARDPVARFCVAHAVLCKPEGPSGIWRLRSRHRNRRLAHSCSDCYCYGDRGLVAVYSSPHCSTSSEVRS